MNKNIKSEVRNPNFETNSNDQNTKLITFWKFGNSKLGFVSDFDIRISDFNNPVCITVRAGI
ncbi:MAG: hypothetical protein COS40_13230 [Deltaproteobacteria bacterium CG03_land_8_20_14_0_80_45_14]|nr:MAG: hypothetical protein COS40_13230 [Deltaproteobacteria bacterium CG03_land_8_20_14_0_80_45_14]